MATLRTVSLLMVVPPVLVGKLPAAHPTLEGPVFSHGVVNHPLVNQKASSELKQLATNVAHMSVVIVSVLQKILVRL